MSQVNYLPRCGNWGWPLCDKGQRESACRLCQAAARPLHPEKEQAALGRGGTFPGERCLLPGCSVHHSGGVLWGPCLPASSQCCPPCQALQTWQHLLPGEQPRSPKPGARKRRCTSLQGDSGAALAGFPGSSCQAGRETCCDRLHLLMESFVALLHLCKEKGGLSFPGELPRLLPLEKVPWLQQMSEKRVRLYHSSHREVKTCLKVYNHQETVYDKPFSALLCLS